MSVHQLSALLAAAAEAGGSVPNFSDPPQKARADFAAFLGGLPVPDGIAVEAREVAGVPGLQVTPVNGSDRVAALYLHGGAYVAGDPQGYLGIIGGIAKASGFAVFAPDYTLAPAKRFPGAVDEALAVYRVLAEEVGADRLTVVGDSAGGGLALALLVAARSAGVPQPAAAVLLSPWADLTCSGESASGRADRDPLLSRQQLLDAAAVYLDGADPRDPLASPALGDLSGLAPITVHVGTEEVLYDDAVRVADASGGTLRAWDGMVHDWALFWFAVDESAEVLAEVGATVASATSIKETI
ncbi:alpha/beta hydrolase fold domain-containing protein [Nocardioides sp. DS6]|uniref:Alpha/beta hydrolase fold domain-containing protein n=1 Tax=Nocardioides eburneus TaxID=3231482 RepID=A0ABV3T0A1_9ACTN